MVDTPGHADFSGEVERILSMVSGVVLVVDATEGPMPQTKFVLRKALEAGLAPIVVINKADRATARLGGEVESDLFDLFAALGASDEQLDYEPLFASAVAGWATDCSETAMEWQLSPPSDDEASVAAILDRIVSSVPVHVPADPSAPFALAVNSIGRDPYLGRLSTGLVESGSVAVGDLCVALGNAEQSSQKVAGIFATVGGERVPLQGGVARAGDIVTVAGVEASVGETITFATGGVEMPLETPPLAPSPNAIYGLSRQGWILS